MEEQLRNYQAVMAQIGRECDEKSKYKTEVGEMTALYEAMRKQI